MKPNSGSILTEDELLALLRLQITPQIGDQRAKKLISLCGDATSIFHLGKKQLLKKVRIRSRILEGLYSARNREAAERELHFIQQHHVRCISYRCPDYPKYLKHCKDGPILLFTRGSFRFSNQKIISLVGTRNSTRYGNSFCEAFVEALVPWQPVIISGFAYGIDIAVHNAAIKHGLPTLAILAHGLNRLYPSVHARYAPKMEQNGGFITEFWSLSKPDRENFLKRNRIIAGISEATILVESAVKGGGMITANMAHGYNRDVFAVPGRAGDPFSQGCNHLIKVQKAHMLTAVEDLVYVLGWDLEARLNLPRQAELFASLDDQEQRIYTYLSEEGKQLLDDIALNCGFPVSQTATLLFGMEMKSCIRPLPGKYFEVV